MVEKLTPIRPGLFYAITDSIGTALSIPINPNPCPLFPTVQLCHHGHREHHHCSWKSGTRRWLRRGWRARNECRQHCWQQCPAKRWLRGAGALHPYILDHYMYILYITPRATFLRRCIFNIPIFTTSYASCLDPSAIAFDSLGHLYIAEFSGHRIRKVMNNTAARLATHPVFSSSPHLLLTSIMRSSIARSTRTQVSSPQWSEPALQAIAMVVVIQHWLRCAPIS